MMIIVIVHNGIIDSHYEVDSTFDKNNYLFFNVSDQPIHSEKYFIVNKSEIADEYINIGKEWAESEVIYNFWKLFENYYNHVGFIHYDFVLYDGFTEKVKELCKTNLEVISFAPMNYNSIKHLPISMDYENPNDIFRFKNNAFHFAFNCLYEYNKALPTYKESIPMCCAFIAKTEVFESVMKYVESVIDYKDIGVFDSSKQNRYQGHIMERVFGLALMQYNVIDLPLTHLSLGKPI